MSVPIIAVDGLSYTYPDGTEALADIDLHIHRGERIALLGPNGAGKTTLILHLNGILMPQRGAVHVNGLPLDGAGVMEIRRRVGIVFQDPDDQLFMPTVEQDVAFGPQNLGLGPDEVAARVERALATVGMSHVRRRPPNHLSFGQKRRVAIAGVLAMEPEILVLDEPTSNLDPASRRELTQLLTGLDITLLVVTHDLPYAAEVCSRAVVLDEGRIVSEGPTLDILGDEALMRVHRLELPFGFTVPGRIPGDEGGGMAASRR